MADYPWSKFFWADWEADQGLRLCSLAAQGLWMRMLCVCARHEPKGYLAINGNPLSVDAIARLAGVTETEAGNLLAELETNGVFSRDRNRRIYSRRMVRDEKRSQEGRKWKKKGLAQASGNNGGNPPPSRGPSRGPSPQKPEARSQKVGSSEPTPREALISVLKPETADAFIAHRKALRAPLTPKAARMIADKLSGFPDPEAAALTSIERGWRGVFPTENITPFPSTGGRSVQPAVDRRQAAATDSLRQRVAYAATTRSPSRPDIFGD